MNGRPSGAGGRRTGRLICADSFKLDWETELRGRKIDLLMVDPPYNTTALDFDGGFDMAKMYGLLEPHLSPAAWVFIWGPMELAVGLLPRCRRKFEYVWTKPRPAPKSYNAKRPMMSHEILWAFIRRDLGQMASLYFDSESLRTRGAPYTERRNDTLTTEHSTQSGIQPTRRKYENRNWGYREGTTLMAARQKGMMRRQEECGHPTLKPLHILEPVLRAHCPPEGLVVDPCSGASSTLLAAINTGRDCICVEREKKYVAMGCMRLRDMPPPIAVLKPPAQTTLEQVTP